MSSAGLVNVIRSDGRARQPVASARKSIRRIAVEAAAAGVRVAGMEAGERPSAIAKEQRTPAMSTGAILCAISSISEPIQNLISRAQPETAANHHARSA